MKIYIIILKKNLTHPYRLQIKIKDNLRKNSIPMSIKLKFIFNKVSQEMVCICSEYIVIKSQITRKIYKQLIPDETKFDEIPDESKYYIKVKNENFMIY